MFILTHPLFLFKNQLLKSYRLEVKTRKNLLVYDKSSHYELYIRFRQQLSLHPNISDIGHNIFCFLVSIREISPKISHTNQRSYLFHVLPDSNNFKQSHTLFRLLSNEIKTSQNSYMTCAHAF